MEPQGDNGDGAAPGGLRVGPALGFGWQVVSGNLGVWLPATLAILAAAVIPDLAATHLEERGALVPAIGVSLLGAVLMGLLWLGMVRMSLDAVDGGHVELATLTGQGDLLLRYIVASLIFGMAVFVGALFLILPGLVVLVFLFFYDYVLVDRRTGILGSLRGSAELGEGHRIPIFLFLVALVAINILGALALFVGLLISLPVTYVASGHAYRQLQGRAV